MPTQIRETLRMAIKRVLMNAAMIKVRLTKLMFRMVFLIVRGNPADECRTVHKADPIIRA